MNEQTIKLSECVIQEQLHAEADRPVLRGVKILGSVSRNRRRYTRAALEQGVRLYEGLPVNIDHPERASAGVRGLRERFGKLVDVRLDADMVRGDLHYNPKHPLAEAVRWWADHQPDAIGLSHHATGVGRSERDGAFVVDKIVSVRAVDLVADPATTQGLFEAVMESNANVNFDDDLAGDEEARAALRQSTDPNVQRLLEAFERQQERRERGTRARALIAEARLPAGAVTDVFVAQLTRTADEAEMRTLIEDRRQLFAQAHGRKPRSLSSGGTALDARQFAEMVRGR